MAIVTGSNDHRDVGVQLPRSLRYMLAGLDFGEGNDQYARFRYPGRAQYVRVAAVAENNRFSRFAGLGDDIGLDFDGDAGNVDEA